jgi:Zn ribbon nucleic-acid-binding protein
MSKPMSVIGKLLCDHQFESMALYDEENLFIKQCRKCGRQIEEQLSHEPTA